VPGEPGTLERIAHELAQALAPLETHLAPNNAQRFIASLGLRLPPALAGDAQLASALLTAATSAAGLPPLVVALTNAISGGDEAQIVSAGATLLAKIVETVRALVQLENALNAIAGSGGLTPSQVAQIEDFAGQLSEKVFDYVVIEYLASKSPDTARTLALIGLIDDESVPGDPADPLSPPYRKRAVHLDRLIEMFLHPDHYLRDAFGLGDPGFDGTALFAKMRDFLERINLPSTLITPPGQPAILDAYLFRLSVDPASSPPALTFRVRIPATHDFEQTYPLGPVWNLHMRESARFVEGIDGAIHPPFAVTLQPPSGTVTIDVEAGLVAQRAGGTVVIFSEGGGTRLEANKIGIDAGFAATFDGVSAHGEPSITAEIAGGKLTIDLSQSDGFISALLSALKLAANLDFKLHWSPSAGLRIEGSSGIEIAIPTHVSLGPVDIERLYIALGIAADGSLPAELSSGFSAKLGPLQASVDRIGIKINTTFPAHGGNLGPANIAFAFKPPNGVGLAVDAGVVKGGGYLYIDTDRGEYAGALELVFADFLSLHAIGLINTKMPDGSSGFSLLIIITAEFAEGIQLGFGFTLLGVGGLLGLNRTMLMQPLMDGVRTGAIESIMFPHDVVKNAQRIISDLRKIFPPQEGTFLIGPMAKIGWGEPTLISVALGIIIEIPPGNIAILGVVRLALPADDVALIVIQVNFAGALEFDKKRMYFFASLFDSRVLFITLEGEMGLLMAFGDDANFVVSIGGFHPQFKPPPLPFPSPRRIEIDILNEDWARIRVTGYFAVTSNSVQFGALCELYFGFSAINVQGHIGFDALIQFSPFHFIVSVSASLSVKVFGIGLFSIDLELSLEGPTPWHAHGTASISILFFSVDVSIDVTWGDSRDTSLPPIAVMPIVTGELGKQSNWRAVLPSGNNLLVSLRKLDAGEADFVLHPVGTLQVSQRAIPLDLTLDKVGNQKPSDAKRFDLAVASGGLVKKRDLLEQFAPAQFLNFDDAAKLSQQAYAPQHGGIELSAAGHAYASGTALTRKVRYDLTIIDTKLLRSRRRFSVQNGVLHAHFLRGASIARNVLSAYRKSQKDPFADKVTVASESFAVALQSNNTVYEPQAAAFASQAAANDYLARAVASDPRLKGQLHVLPAFEVAA
jgi:hypothetical protein